MQGRQRRLPGAPAFAESVLGVATWLSLPSEAGALGRPCRSLPVWWPPWKLTPQKAWFRRLICTWKVYSVNRPSPALGPGARPFPALGPVPGTEQCRAGGQPRERPSFLGSRGRVSYLRFKTLGSLHPRESRPDSGPGSGPGGGASYFGSPVGQAAGRRPFLSAATPASAWQAAGTAAHSVGACP